LPQVERLQIDLRQCRAFDAIADFFQQLHLPQFTISQAVSVARALRPHVEQEAQRRQAHGTTAPGRRRVAKAANTPEFKSREFIARCVGLAPATLRKAEVVIAAAERDPRLLHYAMRMEHDRRPGQAFGALVAGRSLKGCADSTKMAGRDFGARFVGELVKAVASRGKRKRIGSRNGKLPERAPKRLSDGNQR
jgi:hypothetical protein